MTDSRDKLRALFLAALMVISVFGGTVAFAGSAAAVTNAVAMEQATAFTVSSTEAANNIGGIDSGDDAIEIQFNDSLALSTVSASQFEVTFDNDATESPDAVEQGAGSDDGSLILEFDGGLDQPVHNVSEVDVVSGTIGNSQSASSIDSQDVRTATVTVTEDGTDDIAFTGEKIAVVGDNVGEQVFIEADGDFVQSGSVDNDGQVFFFNTKNREADRDYGFDFDGESDIKSADAVNVSLFPLGLAAFVDDATIDTDDELEGNVTANDGGRTVSVTMEDPKGNEFKKRLTLDGQGEADWNFGDPDDYQGNGNYSFTAKDVVTGTEVDADAEIEVEKADKAKAAFGGTSLFRDQRGDVVNITITLDNTDTGTVALGSGDVGYIANVTVEDGNDDDEVILQWNTYAAGPSSSGTIGSPAGSNPAFDIAATPSGDDPDELTVINVTSTIGGGPDDIVEAGDYQLEAVGGDSTVPRTAGAQEVATVALEQRSTNRVRVHTAPGERIDDIESKKDVYDNIANGNITRDRSVAGEDALIVEVGASGIEGAILDQSGAAFTTQFTNFVTGANPPARMLLNQTNTETNKVQKILDVNDTERVIDDSNNDTYFVIVDMDTVDVARDNGNEDNRFDSGDSSASLSDNDEFEANFSVLKNRDGLARNRQTVSQQWKFVDAEAEVTAPETGVIVSSAANQTIRGTTTVAAGTELTVRVESEEAATPFLMTEDVFVEANEEGGEQNTWTVDFDFSGIPTGTNFTVDVQRAGSSLLDEDEDGRVAAAPQASVTFEDQDSDGTIVTVQSVTMNRGGFVAIHFRTASGPVIGTSKLLAPGTHENVRIVLDDAISQDRTLVAMPHLDDNANNAYDFPEADAPYTTNETGNITPVTDSAQINIVEEETPGTPTVSPTPGETPTPRIVTASPRPSPTPREVTRTVVQTREVTRTVERTVTVTPEQTPGFGIAIAIVALLAAALLAVRRRE